MAQSEPAPIPALSSLSSSSSSLLLRPYNIQRLYLNQQTLQIDKSLLSRANLSSITRTGRMFLNLKSPQFEEYTLYRNIQDENLLDKCIDKEHMGIIHMLKTISNKTNNMLKHLTDSYMIILLDDRLVQIKGFQKNKYLGIAENTNQLYITVPRHINETINDFDNLTDGVNRFFDNLNDSITKYNKLLGNAYDGMIQKNRWYRLGRLTNFATADTIAKNYASLMKIRSVRITKINGYGLNSMLDFWNINYASINQSKENFFIFYEYVNKFQKLEYAYLQIYPKQQRPKYVQHYLTLDQDPLYSFIRDPTTTGIETIQQLLYIWKESLNNVANVYAHYFTFNYLQAIDGFWNVIGQLIIYATARHCKNAAGRCDGNSKKMYKFYDTNAVRVSVLNEWFPPLLEDYRNHLQQHIPNLLKSLQFYNNDIVDIGVKIESANRASFEVLVPHALRFGVMRR